MSIFNDFFKKEKPVFTGFRFGFGSGGGGGGAGGPFPGMPSDEVQTTYGGNGAPGIVIVAYPT